ncbi:MAG: LPS export ABC transporter ATP-binding protein [Alphaproteobacteria bacterium]|nr:LPS export ABC transporter ATP-binding protein [Alphaproteobacteria bacterium]
MNTTAREALPNSIATPHVVVDNQLEAFGLRKSYHNKAAINGIQMSIRRGEAVGLLGPNGAGKTTTFYLLAGLLKPDAGRIVLDGVDITHLPTYMRAQYGLAYLPQEISVFRGLSVAENILAVLEVSEPKPEKRQQRLAKLLEQFRLEHLYDSPALSLSGGERRKLEIARLMAGCPRYVLMDEPLAGVDPLAVNEIRKQISNLCAEGIGVCITDHNVRDTLAIVQRAYIVHDGRILREGTPEEIADDDDVRRVYLGDHFSL